MGKKPVTIDTEELRALLQEEAAREPSTSGPRSIYQTVKALMPEIEALLAARRTKKEVVDLLASKGVDINLGTFGTYYARAKRELGSDTKPTTTRTPRKREPVGKANTNETSEGTVSSVAATPKPQATTSGKKALGGFGQRFADDDENT